MSKSYIIGIDVGGSATKICGFRPKDGGWELIDPMHVRATDPITSVYGAFGKFTNENGISLEEITEVRVTGVGSTYLDKPLYGIPCVHVEEFRSTGLGGLYLSGLERAIVASMGTGTALIHAIAGQEMEYLGGTGVGGGTLHGLARLLLGMDNVTHVSELAGSGDIGKIDLQVKDITKKDIIPDMPDYMTAANFGKVSDLAGKPDIALGIINMIFETIGMLCIFAARSHGTRDIVLTGNMTNVAQCRPIFDNLSEMFKVSFMIPEKAQFGPVIGAALTGVGGE
ncbi:MAG: type II pantothenate kinase [Clostridiales bacterium]|nr:type II pantothenate kinase [Clostridiales bacterium]